MYTYSAQNISGILLSKESNNNPNISLSDGSEGVLYVVFIGKGTFKCHWDNTISSFCDVGIEDSHKTLILLQNE